MEGVGDGLNDGRNGGILFQAQPAVEVLYDAIALAGDLFETFAI
jgi:hypothetical protein